MAPKPLGLSSVACLAPGEYTIGSDLIPNSGPEHCRTLSTKIWIDSDPLSWAHFEVFVAAAGYRHRELWTEALQAGMNEPQTESVDQRCRQLLEAAAWFRGSLGLNLQEQRQLPLTGITWFEASAICRFYGARLPFEVEWESAMQINNAATAKLASESWPTCPTSDIGCQVFVGKMQEWTADAYQQQYWNADFDKRGSKWDLAQGNHGVVVRGASPQDLYQHLCYRTSRLPHEGDRCRGFRRVWDTEPSADKIHAFWQQPLAEGA